MAFTYSTTIQDRIALTVFGVAYSSLNSTQKTHLDGTWSSGSLTTGAAYDALTQITTIANWFEMAGATSAPQSWEAWLVAETAMLLSKVYRPDLYSQYSADREKAIDILLDGFAARDPTGAFSSSNTSVTLSVNGLRMYVLMHCARRKESGTNTGMRRRIFVPVDEIDAHIQWTLNYIFNKEFWNFRKRTVTMVVNYLAQPTAATWTESSKTLTQTGAFTNLSLTNGTARILIASGTGAIVGDKQIVSKTSADAIVLGESISTDSTNLTTGDIVGYIATTEFRGLLSGETFDAVASRRFFYSSNNDAGGMCNWADATQMARSVSYYGTTRGRPSMFRTDVQPPSTISWQLSPFPDASYVLHGAVFATGPGLPSSATETTTIQKFPTEFGPVIRDMVLARVLLHYGASDAERVWGRAVDQVVSLLPQFADQGYPVRMVAAEDVYMDRDRQMGQGSFPFAGGWYGPAVGLT